MVARAYGHDPMILVGLLKVEGGRVGMKNQNRNKSYDYGVAQINSAWLDRLQPVGLGEQELIYEPCKNLWAAGWILKRCVDRHQGQIWAAVGCYHAGENARTRQQLERKRNYSARVQKYLQSSQHVVRHWLSGQYRPVVVQGAYTVKAQPVRVTGVSMEVKDAP